MRVNLGIKIFFSFLVLMAIAFFIFLGSNSASSANKIINGLDIDKTISNHNSWMVMADWTFAANSNMPTRFQGKAYYVDKGKTFLWLDHGYGSTIPVRVYKGILDAPTEEGMVNIPLTEKKAKERLEHDLFYLSPVEYAKISGVKLFLNKDSKFLGSALCEKKFKSRSNCYKLDFELSLNKRGLPETIIMKQYYDKVNYDKISFYFSDYNKVDLASVEKSINFTGLTPPDYNKMASELDLDAAKKIIDEAKSSKR